MKYSPGTGRDALYTALEPVVRGLGMSLVETTLSRHRGSVQVRVTVDKRGGLSTEDCSRVHRAIIPRLELTLESRDLYVEVSSPGLNRPIRDGAEFAYFIGRGVKCYLVDRAAWTGGVVQGADENAVTIRGKEGLLTLPYERIGKAKLDPGEEV